MTTTLTPLTGAQLAMMQFDVQLAGEMELPPILLGDEGDRERGRALVAVLQRARGEHDGDAALWDARVVRGLRLLPWFGQSVDEMVLSDGTIICTDVRCSDASNHSHR